MQVVVSQVSPVSKLSGQFSKNNQVPATVNMALFATYKSNEEAIDDVCHYIINNLSDIIQLPELLVRSQWVATSS